MAKVRFYRSSDGVYLPPIQNGSIIVVQREGSDSQGFNYGDIYVDVNDATRLRILPNNEYKTYNTNDLNLKNIIPAQGFLCMITNTKNQQIGVVIGDGITNLNTLIKTSLIPNITYTDHLPVNFWNNKINAYIGTDIPKYNSKNLDTIGQILNIINPEETLVLTALY